MAEVTGFTAARMQIIEDSAVVGGTIIGNDLILSRHDGTTFNAGNVRGAQGVVGPPGPTSVDIVTSTTHPSAPVEGQGIFETDTNRLLFWTGAAWAGLTPNGVVSVVDAWHYIGTLGQPAFANSWVNIADGDNSEPLRFRKRFDKLGELRGRISSGNRGTVVCILPVGTRPDYHVRQVASVYDGTQRYPAMTALDVTGELKVYSETTGIVDPITEVDIVMTFPLPGPLE